MRKTIAILAAAFAVAGCGAVPPPEVTFYADGESVRTGPQLLCDVGAASCVQDDDAVVSLDFRAGYPVQISVPAALANEPWGVVFSYLNGDGERVDGSSRVFVPGQFPQHAYTLDLPSDSDRLLFVAVQRLAIFQGIPFPTGCWILQADVPSEDRPVCANPLA